MICSIETSDNKERFNSPGNQKESAAKDGEIKYGRLQFLLCDNPATVEEATGTPATSSVDLRHFRLTNDSIDRFQKDSQVY